MAKQDEGLPRQKGKMVAFMAGIVGEIISYTTYSISAPSRSSQNDINIY